MILAKELPGSFRDPSGFLFTYNNFIYRQINYSYQDNYDQLISSGLYDSLISSGLLIPHEEVDLTDQGFEKDYKTIKPEIIPFISYPYEWCFSELKDAALLTLQIQKKALEFGMSLKDCSAYNIQFRNGKPILIDTLSFEKYREGEPWVAYKQFCQHFLAPLALMSRKDIRFNQLFRIYIDGVPLDLASSLLSSGSYLSFPLLTHIHLHAKSQKIFSDKKIKKNKSKISRHSFLGLIDSLEGAVKKLKWKPQGTEWGDYYTDTNYSEKGLNHKVSLVSEFVKTANPNNAWDLGSNDGFFSRVVSDKGILTMSFDIDPAAVEKNYLRCVKNNEQNILPLLLDLTNPSSDIGWANNERMSLIKRGPVDLAMSLALIHHLAISNNLPFNRIARFFKNICSFLIIEFVPKWDSQVQRLLATREDIFKDYTQESFEESFGEYFTILSSAKIMESERVLYLMKKEGYTI